jgi:DNA-directed RNA polymerase subunit L
MSSRERITVWAVYYSQRVDNADKLGILSAGYYKPHPLENQISMNVKGKSVIKDPEALYGNVSAMYRTHWLQVAFSKVFAK